MTDARQVPSLVAAHQDYLRGLEYQEYAARYLRSAWEKSDERFKKLSMEAGFELDKAVEKMGREWCSDEHDLLNIARLFHVSESMTEVAKHAARQLDDNELWNFSALPSPAGVLVFEKPLRVEDVWGKALAFSAVTWHWRLGFYGPAPGRPTNRRVSGPLGDVNDRAIQFNFYTDNTQPGDDYTPELLRLRREEPNQWSENLGRWELSHMVAHFDGTKIGPFDLHAIDDDLYTEWRAKYREDHAAGRLADPAASAADQSETVGEYIVSSVNVPRILFSIFALMDQTITDVSDYTDRQYARRTRNKRKPPPVVTIIRLRHAKAHGTYEEGTGNWLTYRSVTAGHWRWQPYGPGRSEVKRIWINPYIRGPEDAPFHQPKRVATLVR